MARLTLRIELDPAGALGPGKIRLLELIREHGSISAAGRAMEMSYRRAWLLIDSLNACFAEPVVRTALGGRHGGGAEVTEFGATLIAEYRAIEEEAARSVAPRLRRLQRALKRA